MAQNTISFELSRGYIDTEGNAHKLVELRAPTINDEVIADRKLALLSASQNPEQRAEGNSETLWEIEVMAACCLKLGSIIKVTSDHIRQLARSDARLMLAKLNEVEAKLMKAEAAPNSSTGEQGSSNSPS